MSTEELVVSYDAIDNAALAFQGVVTSLDGALGSVKSVTGLQMHARALDQNLGDLMATVQNIGADLLTEVAAMIAFLQQSEAMYRYVDKTVLTRDIPYDPSHPAPTLGLPLPSDPRPPLIPLKPGGPPTEWGIPGPIDGPTTTYTPPPSPPVHPPLLPGVPTPLPAPPGESEPIPGVYTKVDPGNPVPVYFPVVEPPDDPAPVTQDPNESPFLKP